MPFNEVHAASRGQEVGVWAGLGDAVREEDLPTIRIFAPHNTRGSVVSNKHRRLFADAEASSAPLLRTSQLQRLILVLYTQEFARVEVRSNKDGELIVFRRIDSDAPSIRIRTWALVLA